MCEGVDGRVSRQRCRPNSLQSLERVGQVDFRCRTFEFGLIATPDDNISTGLDQAVGNGFAGAAIGDDDDLGRKNCLLSAYLVKIIGMGLSENLLFPVP